MNEKKAQTKERLAKYAHKAWSGWMNYLFEKSTKNNDGTVTIPKWAVDRWKRQASTSYCDLPESEKESDRKEADAMLACFNTNIEENKEKTLLALKHREITLMNHRLDALRNASDEDIEKIDRLLKSLRENIKKKEQSKQKNKPKKCPACGEKMDEECDLLDLMPDIYYVCPNCGKVEED